MALRDALSVVFPAFKHGLREPDPMFQKEAAALDALGIPYHVVNIDALMDGEDDRVLRYIGEPSTTTSLYRGWLLHPFEYRDLYRRLTKIGFHLFTTPGEYENGLLFPKFFPYIEHNAIPAAWIEGHDAGQAIRAAERLGNPPYYIKDYAKSAKEIGPNGCVVKGDDLEQDMRDQIEALVEHRGDRFEGGIVIRPMYKLNYLDECTFGGPIYEEYRLFFFQGQIISKTIYQRVGGDPQTLPDYSDLGATVPSRFFTADIVVTEDGRRFILEIGDGGVSGLPPAIDPVAFYNRVLNFF